MRPLSILSLFLLVSICAVGSACDTHTNNNNNAPVNSASPVATQSPSQTPALVASPGATASPSSSPTQLTYSVYKDAKGEWRWRLVAANNRIIADSGEGYHNRQDCLAAIELIKNSKAATVSDAK